MASVSRQDVERLFRQKLAELNHLEITSKKEFTPIVDACLKYLTDHDIVPKSYSDGLDLLDHLTKGTIRSAISRELSSVLGLAITCDTVQATYAAMQDVLQWLDSTKEQDPDRIGYIIDEYIRYYSVFYSENLFEDAAVLKQFEPDLAFRKYRK